MKKVLFIVTFAGSLAALLTTMIILRQEKPQVELTRSVTAVRLERLNPVEKMKLTGTVQPWKEENLSFEVPGRINWVIDKGSEVIGNKNAYSVFNGEGALVAKLDDQRYRLKLKSAQANVKTAKAELEALTISADNVIIRQLESAKADMDNAEKEFERVKGLIKKEAASQKLYDSIETNYKKSNARYSEVMALITVRKSEIAAAEARLEQLNQAVADAELDLKRTELRVPYQGQISNVFADVGANVKSGQKVARLIGMDPMLITLNLSTELDNKFHYTDSVLIYPPDGRDPIVGIVNRKAATADANTHTFRLELLVRNRIVTTSQNIPDELTKLPHITRSWPISDITWHGEQKMAVIADSIHTDEKGDFLWLITEKNGLPGTPIYTVKKQHVELLPGEHSLLGTYNFRVLKSSQGLKNMDFAAVGVPDGVKDFDKVIQIRKRRMFRPGDFVKVVLENNATEAGLYVPLKMVSGDSTKNWVFKIIKQSDGSSIAQQIFITIKDRFNDQVLIESPSLSIGDILINEGAHFLVPNEKVNVKSIEKVSL